MIPPDPQLPPLLAEGLFHASAAPGPVCVTVHRSPAAPDLQRQRQGPPGGGQRPGPLPRPRFGPLQLLLLPLLPMLLQRHLPAPCVWGLYGESSGRGGGRCPAAPGVWAHLDCTPLPGLLCFLLHRGLPEDRDGAACGKPAAAGGRRGHRVQPDVERGEACSQLQGFGSRASWAGPSCLLVIQGFYRWSGQGLSASPLK